MVQEGASAGPPLPPPQSEGVVNLSDQNLKKISLPESPGAPVTKLILDRNHIFKVDGIPPSVAQCLQQLSVASNRIVRMGGLSHLSALRVLNLPHNSIATIEGIKELKQLTWLNLSNNNIKSLANLSHNTKLRHVDVSENNLTSLVDLRSLVELKTLMLHGNLFSSLAQFPDCLPTSITVLSLAENEVTDLCQVSHLAFLTCLEQLSLAKNPAVEFAESRFDWRSYVLNWCLYLGQLDGQPITHRESLKAEWLYTQGKGRRFRPGEMNALTEYLKTHCALPTSETDQSNEDVRLSKVLNKQIQYQRQQPLDPGDILQSVSSTPAPVRNDESLRRRVDVTHHLTASPRHPPVERSPVPTSDQSYSQFEQPPRQIAAERELLRSQATSNTSPNSRLAGERTDGVRNSVRVSAEPAVVSMYEDDESSEEDTESIRLVTESVHTRSIVQSTERGAGDRDSPLVSESFLIPARSPSPRRRNEPHVTHISSANDLDPLSTSEMLPVPAASPPKPVLKKPVPAQSSSTPSRSHTDRPHTALTRTPVVQERPRGLHHTSVIQQIMSSDHLFIFNIAATTIQAAWRGHWVRSRPKYQMRLLRKKLETTRRRVAELESALATEKSFRKATHKILAALCAEVAKVSRIAPNDDISISERNDDLSELAGQFSRISHQTSLNIYSARDANDSFDSSLRVASLTEDDLSNPSGGGLEATDVEDEGEEANSTFTHDSHVSPGTTPPPTALRARQKSDSAVLVSWRASHVPASTSRSFSADISILSYKIFVDHALRGAVSGAKCKAVIDGLETGRTYSISVRSVTALGESMHSEPLSVVLHPFSPSKSQQKRSPKSVWEDTERTPVKSMGLSTIEDDSEEFETPRAEKSAPSFITIPSNVSVEAGNEARFVAVVSNGCEAQVSWMVNSVHVKDGGRFMVASDNNSHTLVIKECSVSDAGTVTCVAQNSVSKVSSIANFEVMEPSGQAENQSPSKLTLLHMKSPLKPHVTLAHCDLELESELSPRAPLSCTPALQYTSLTNLVPDDPLDSPGINPASHEDIPAAIEKILTTHINQSHPTNPPDKSSAIKRSCSLSLKDNRRTLSETRQPQQKALGSKERTSSVSLGFGSSSERKIVSRNLSQVLRKSDKCSTSNENSPAGNEGNRTFVVSHEMPPLVRSLSPTPPFPLGTSRSMNKVPSTEVADAAAAVAQDLTQSITVSGTSHTSSSDNSKSHIPSLAHDNFFPGSSSSPLKSNIPAYRAKRPVGFLLTADTADSTDQPRSAGLVGSRGQFQEMNQFTETNRPPASTKRLGRLRNFKTSVRDAPY